MTKNHVSFTGKTFRHSHIHRELILVIFNNVIQYSFSPDFLLDEKEAKTIHSRQKRFFKKIVERVKEQLRVQITLVETEIIEAAFRAKLITLAGCGFVS